MALLNLPLDLLVLITPHLDTPSFLAFTSTCQALHSAPVREDPLFWSARVRRDFRVPNQPVVANDGQRWMKLYKRMRTQSRIFAWGNNDRQCLGHSRDPSEPDPRLRLRGRMMGRVLPRRMMQKSHTGTPEEMVGIKELGVIADLQSGGWSTTLLTAKGALYTVGVLNGMEYRHRSHPSPYPLAFPSNLSQAGPQYDAITAIKQFSAGRGHILALSDSGRIWSWSNMEHPAVNVKLLDHDMVESGQDRGKGVVKKVVAGWNKSAALIEGTGIVVWEPLDREGDETDRAVTNGRVASTADAALVLESALILRTGHVNVRHTKGKGASTTEDPAEAVGEVQSFIVLSDSIVFNTSRGKVFASLITWTEDRKTLSEPVELPIPQDAFVTDVQGSFENFAIFLKSGAVLTSKQDALMPHLTGSGDSRLWTRIPALQNKSVIALAFGDYHFHALHAPGHITSYGYQPQNCGALGLGDGGVAAQLRGIRTRGVGGDGHLLPHAYTEGRKVWFERPKREWLSFLAAGGHDREEAEGRLQMATASDRDGGCQGEVSEWIEQEARNWSKKYSIDAGDDGLGAYFALGVTAAGWHSGALVLVNDELVETLEAAVEVKEDAAAVVSTAKSIEQVTLDSTEPENPETTPTLWGSAVDYGKKFLGNGSSVSESSASSSSSTAAPDPPAAAKTHVWEQDSFPRLRLSDGREMPGRDDRGFDEWAFGRPEWQFGWEGGEDI
ncbi:uncharacterized protein RCC_05952 [Ramularia collo-cygni]|uniref:F-box domain-containing protein n=1 Tax=Ramularia collo-cygni TaxID=112498 RepID=A0A2D3V054_9PEZI|nr:uncharacterized protein RCC_05952 [Ramularia collo-cygni]CZT20095.1 uncharacterized protein RCC_05952 [Ramularia collo-cygni]